MKKYLKRVNRGIVLFILMIIVFIIYVIADTISFRDNKPVVKSVLDNFMTELAVCNVAPEAAQSADSAVRAGAEEAWTKQVEDLTNKYFCYAGNKESAFFYYGTAKSEWLRNAKNMVSDCCGTKQQGYVLNCDCKMDEKSLKISKSGVNIASVEVTYRYTVAYAGNPSILIPGGYDMRMHHLLNWYSEDQEATFDRNVQNTAVVDVFTSYMMKKVDGEWKIMYSDYRGWKTVSMTDTGADEDAVKPDQKGDVE